MADLDLSFIGVALLSLTGAYSLTMVGALYYLIAEVVRGRAGRKLSLGLLATALACIPLNLAVYFVMGMVSAFSIFDPPFMIGVSVVGPLLAIGCAIVAAVLAWRSAKRVRMTSLVSFAIWMAGVGIANVWLIGKISESV